VSPESAVALLTLLSTLGRGGPLDSACSSMAPRTSPFCQHVLDVVALGADEEVRWLTARWVVAVVEHQQSRWDSAMCQFPSESMRQDDLSPPADAAISSRISAARPLAAFTVGREAIPEFLVLWSQKLQTGGELADPRAELRATLPEALFARTEDDGAGWTRRHGVSGRECLPARYATETTASGRDTIVRDTKNDPALLAGSFNTGSILWLHREASLPGVASPAVTSSAGTSYVNHTFFWRMR